MSTTDLSTPRLAFIGAGNMGGAILRGLLRQGYPAATITATGRNAETLQQLAAETGVQVTTDNAAALADADLVVLGVKPQGMKAVCLELAASLQATRPLVLSIAAGLTADILQGWLGGSLPLVRAMPNTPCLLGAGITGVYAVAGVTQQQRLWAEQIFQAVGQCCWVEQEQQMDAVTAISGSGPAYYFLFTEALAAAGEKLGLPADLALQLARQTAAGAGQMLAGGDEPVELRRQVTSPGGTTERAIQCFEAAGLRPLVHEAARAAAARAIELAQALKG